jgi:hypothetical protein
MMNVVNATTLQRTIKKLFRPVVRMMLRNGVAFTDLAEWLKRLYVDVAEKEFAVEGRKQSVARISVLTGLNRKDVKRLLEEPLVQERYQASYNRAQRVVSGWMTDTDFMDGKGCAKPLDINDKEMGFPAVVKRYSGDIPPRAILDELLRVGVVEKREGCQLKLKKRGYVPHRSDEQMLDILAESGADLLESMDHNLVMPTEQSRLQLRIVYDNLPRESVDIFRDMSRDRAHEFLQSLDQFLSTQDRDANPQSKGQGRYRAGMGVYYFEQELDDETTE